MRNDDGLDRPYLAELLARWGIAKLEAVTGYSRASIYQWRPSRSRVPADAALRICELARDRFVERLCPELPWHLLYRGRDRQNGDARAKSATEAVQAIGATAVARAAGRSRQNIYEAMRSPSCPVWLALAIEQASAARFVVEQLRPDLPWWPLYDRRMQTYPLNLERRA